MTLRELEPGDRFIHAKARNKRIADVFRVIGNPEFNLRAGTATRKCNNLTKLTGGHDKRCSLEVIKLN